MNNPKLEDVYRMVQALNKLHDDTGDFLNDYGHQPSPNSKAHSELRTFPRQQSVIAAFSQGTVLIEVSADQLMAFIKTVTQPAQSIAPWTCTRALMEASALSTWLLDPKIDARTRVKRSFAFRYEGLVQQKKYAKVAGTNADVEKVGRRIDQVEAVALNLGFDRFRNKREEIIGIAQLMPTITDLINQTLHEEKTYRFLSAIAHAHYWALHQVSFRQIPGESIRFPDDTDEGKETPLIEKSLSTLSTAFLCIKSALIFTRPVWFKCELFGWDSEKLRGILNQAFNTIGFKQNNNRFSR